jgi:hypothetical protein
LLDNLGAPVRNRTRDPLITSQVLYHLSYKGELQIIKRKSGLRYPYAGKPLALTGVSRQMDQEATWKDTSDGERLTYASCEEVVQESIRSRTFSLPSNI